MESTKSLSVLQINLRKSKLPSVALCRNREEDIIMVQEPYTTSNKPSLLGEEGYTLLHVDNYKSNVRTALLARNTLQAWRVDGLCTPDITVAVILVNNRVVYAASTYCDINIKMHIVLGKLLHYFNTHKVLLLMGADSNAHSSIWGCVENNDRGDEMEDLLDQYELTVLNVGNTPTYFRTDEDGTKSETIIDITVTNKFANNINVNDWQVLEEETYSDHKYISYTFISQYETFLETIKEHHRCFSKHTVR